MTHKVGSGKHLGRSLATMTAAILLASVSLVTIPTKASAFDIGGMIGTAMAIQMQMTPTMAAMRAATTPVAVYRRARIANQTTMAARVVTGERDAREPNAPIISHDRATNWRWARTQSPASTSDGLSQASERDAAAGQAQGSSRTFNDAPAFSPSR